MTEFIHLRGAKFAKNGKMIVWLSVKQTDLLSRRITHGKVGMWRQLTLIVPGGGGGGEVDFHIKGTGVFVGNFENKKP